MAVQYNKLWKLLIDKKIKPSALSKMTGIAPSTMAKMWLFPYWNGSA